MMHSRFPVIHNGFFLNERENRKYQQKIIYNTRLIYSPETEKVSNI